MNIRKDDKVVVLSGKDKGKQGKILTAFPSEGKVIIEGVNVGKRHKKARNQNEESGIIKVETPIYVSKVMLVCPKCGKGTRIAHTVNAKGDKVRVCKKCGAEM